MKKIQYAALAGIAVFMIVTLVWMRGYQSTLLPRTPTGYVESQALQLNNTPSNTPSVFPYPTLTKECFLYDKLSVENICCQMHDFHKLPDILQCAEDTSKYLRAMQSKNVTKRIHKKSSGGTVEAAPSSNSPIGQQPTVNWAFIGDSHTRYIFCAIYSRMRSKDFQCRIPNYKGKWKSLDYLLNTLPTCTYKGGKIEIRHVRLPFVLTFYRDVYLTEITKLAAMWDANEHLRPTFIVMNTGNHWMRRLESKYVKSGVQAAGKIFENHLRKITPVLRRLANKTTVVFKMQDDLQTVHHNESKVVSFSTANIQLYNGVFRRVLAHTGVLLWDSTLPVSLAYSLECMKNPRHIPKTLWWMCNDRTHVGYILLHQYAEMVLNVACNKYMVLEQNSCHYKESVNLLQ